MSHKLFGTDGIRGLANHYPLDPATVLQIGVAVATHFRANQAHPQIVIGRDTRLSGNMLESALIAGITSLGVNVIHLGVVPTAFVSHMTQTIPAIAGIMLSASHNSFEDNGIKIFQPNGYKCDDEIEKKLTDLILHPSHTHPTPVGPHLGKITFLSDPTEIYREFILQSWPKQLDLGGIRIALDTANGAAYETAPGLLRGLGAELFLFHHEPNGININLDCGSTHPQFIQRETKLSGAQVGFAFDGDADRLICCDETGAIVDGDEIMAILALDLLREGKLKNKTLVATTQSNLGLDECLEQAGGRVIRSEVGDRYVMAALLKDDLLFGGEQSGHIILRHIMPTSDGLLTALQILRIMRQSGQPLSLLRQCLKKYPQVQINLAVKEKRPLKEMPAVETALKETRATLGARGRINFRYSGTEAKARLLLEGSDEKQLHFLAQQIVNALRQENL